MGNRNRKTSVICRRCKWCAMLGESTYCKSPRAAEALRLMNRKDIPLYTAGWALVSNAVANGKCIVFEGKTRR